MKKILVSIMMMAVFSLFATFAVATCYEGSCDPAPTPCGTPECAGAYGGTIKVDSMGYAEAWGDNANAFVGAVYDVNKHINKNGVTGDVNLFGGFSAQTNDMKDHALAGGASSGIITWSVEEWKAGMTQ